MNCFVHEPKQSIAVCLVCGRGLCADCGVDVGKLFVCRNRCETQAQKSISMHAYALNQPVMVERMRRTAKRTRIASALFMLVLGVAELAAAWMSGRWTILGPMGGICALWGATSLFGALKTPVREVNFSVCHRCGYNLTGVSGERCPECGIKV